MSDSGKPPEIDLSKPAPADSGVRLGGDMRQAINVTNMFEARHRSQAEIERLKSELQKVRDENERMMAGDYWHDRYKIVVKEFAEYRKENSLSNSDIFNLDKITEERDRYKAALERIAYGLLSRPDGKWGYECSDIAKAALAREVLKGESHDV